MGRACWRNEPHSSGSSAQVIAIAWRRPLGQGLKGREILDSNTLLDIASAARLLGVSETSLRRWTNSGQLACLRVGQRRERRFRRADLLAFLEDQPSNASARAEVSGGPKSPFEQRIVV